MKNLIYDKKVKGVVVKVTPCEILVDYNRGLTGYVSADEYSYDRNVDLTKEVKEGVTYHNYLFGFYNAKKGLGVTEGYNDNDFLMGFWISKGTGAFYNNSAHLPIDEATAEKMNLGVSYNDFKPTTGAKKVPALFFDFANADDTTGIDEVVNTTVKNNDGKYYTLSGLQVEKPTAGGVYIHNGKKFVVR